MTNIFVSPWGGSAAAQCRQEDCGRDPCRRKKQCSRPHDNQCRLSSFLSLSFSLSLSRVFQHCIQEWSSSKEWTRRPSAKNNDTISTITMMIYFPLITMKQTRLEHWSTEGFLPWLKLLQARMPPSKPAESSTLHRPLRARESPSPVYEKIRQLCRTF